MAAMEPSFPTELAGGTDGIERTHDKVTVTPFGDRTLGYALVLPKGWAAETDLGEQRTGVGLPVRLGLFADHAGDDAAVVDVSYTLMPMEVGLLDWVHFHAERSGVRLTRCEPMQFAAGPGVDAGGLYGPQESPRVVRMVALVDAGRIFTATAMTPAARYESLLRDVAFATHGFKLTAPTGHRFLEQWLDAEPAEAPAFHVAHPATWTARPVHPPAEAVPGRSGVDLLLSQDGALMAYVRVKALDITVAGDPPEAQKLRDATDELTMAGVHQHGGWTADTDPMVHLVEGLVASWQSTGGLADTDVELRFGQVERHGLQFLVTSMGVRRADDVLLWMRTRRAYHIALATAHR